MSEQETEEEPSIEEILTSIRQIISDDDEEAAAEEAPAEEVVPEPEPEAEPEEEVIELTDKIDEEPEVEEAAPESTPIEVEMLDSEPPAEETMSEPEPMPVYETQARDDALLTDTAEDAAFDAFSELAKKTAVQHGGITVEEIVRSELRPLLKGWLDKHLPSIIERLVQEELERVAKRALDD